MILPRWRYCVGTTDGRRIAGRIGTLVVLCLITTPAALQAQKTDTLTLDNGDRITGEIKELAQGRLRYSTDAANTIFVEWIHVRELWTDKFLEIELESGERVFGSIVPAEETDKLTIRAARLVLTVDRMSIVAITPIKSTFWSRLDGLIELGFDFKKQNHTLNVSSTVEVNYRPRKFIVTLRGDTYLLKQDSLADVTRNNASLTGIWLPAERWFLLVAPAWEENSELKLDSRGSLAVGGGRVFTRTNSVEWYSWLGLSFNREKLTDVEDPTSNLEGQISSRFRWFTFGSHETSLSADLDIRPSFTEAKRWRIDFETAFRRDLILDFYIVFKFYDQFDSRGEGQESQNDYGVTFALGYDF
jgi:hypothetical protein